MSKAGENIRELAARRRSDAVKNFILAGLGGTLPLITLVLPLPTGLKILAFIGGLVSAVVSIQKGQHLLLRARQADQGAKGEETVAKLLQPLERQGWKIEYNIRVPRWGDVDVFLSSPKGNHFAIDTKSNKGGIFYDGRVLKRRYGKNVYEFSNGKDLLQAVKGQAQTIKEIKRVGFVQPILCFAQANLREIDQSNMISGVYVLDGANLLKLLNKIDRK